MSVLFQKIGFGNKKYIFYWIPFSNVLVIVDCYYLIENSKDFFIKKAKYQIIDIFQLWCWRSLLRVPWTARSNQSIPKEINPKYWSFNIWPHDIKTQHIVKKPDAGKDWRQKKRVTEDEMVGWHHRCNGHELGQTLGVGEGQGSLGVLQSTRLQRVRRDLVTEHHTLTAKHFKQSYTRAKKSTNFIQPSSSHAVWSESFVCLIKCVNTLESTLWGKFLSFQKRRPKQTNQQKYIGGCYGAMPRAPRAVSAMVLTDLCHLPSLRQQPGHSSHPREPDPPSLLTAQLPGKRSEYHPHT